MSGLFEARWDGECPECGSDYDAGHDVGFIDEHDKPVCEECWDAARTVEP